MGTTSLYNPISALYMLPFCDKVLHFPEKPNPPNTIIFAFFAFACISSIDDSNSSCSVITLESKNGSTSPFPVLTS